MNRQETARLVAVICAASPAQSGKLTPKQQVEMLDAYEALLSDLSYADANAAVTVLLQTRTWMPSVADIRAMAVELKRGPMASGGDQWGNVTRAMREKGAYRTPGTDFVFSDPVTARVVQQMHWPTLCLSEHQVADRARFIELYDKLANDARREIQAPALAAAREQREIGEQSVEVGKLIALVAGKTEP